MHIFILIHLIPLHKPLCGKEYAKHDCHFNLFWLKKVLGRYKHIKLPTQHHHWQHTKPKCLHPRAALPRLVYLWCGVLHAIVLFRSLEGTRRTWAFWSAAILGPGPSLSGMLLGMVECCVPPNDTMTPGLSKKARATLETAARTKSAQLHRTKAKTSDHQNSFCSFPLACWSALLFCSVSVRLFGSLALILCFLAWTKLFLLLSAPLLCSALFISVNNTRNKEQKGKNTTERRPKPCAAARDQRKKKNPSHSKGWQRFLTQESNLTAIGQKGVVWDTTCEARFPNRNLWHRQPY